MQYLHGINDAGNHRRIGLLGELNLRSVNEVRNRQIRLRIAQGRSNPKLRGRDGACHNGGLPRPELIESAPNYIPLAVRVSDKIRAILQTAEHLLDLNWTAPDRQRLNVIRRAAGVPVSAEYGDLIELKEVVFHISLECGWLIRKY